MALFKQKVPLPGLIRTLLAGMIKKGRFGTDDPDLGHLNLEAMDPSEALSQEERARLMKELPIFIVAAQFFEFLDLGQHGRLRFDLEEFGRTYAIALAFAFSDSGLSDEQAQERAEEYFDVIFDYLDALEGAEEVGLAQHEVCYHASRHFQERVLGEQLGFDREDREGWVERWATVSSIADQTHRNIAEATAEILKNVRPVM